MTAIPCFLLEPADEGRVDLRRYVSGSTCPIHGYHHTRILIGSGRVILGEGGTFSIEAPEIEDDDPRWPTHCDCGYAFQAEEPRQVFTERQYRRSDSGELTTLQSAPAGAMWFADWFNDFWAGPDGRCLVVKTPGGDWVVDGPASNCGRPDDRDQKQHHCWVRHGAAPMITVDKDGPTCSAGAGSIQAGSYHGFLRNGQLVE